MTQRHSGLRRDPADSSNALLRLGARRLIIAVLGAASICAAVLLVIAAIPLWDQVALATRLWARRQIPRMSAAPLLLSGIALTGAQSILRPPASVMLKRLMLSAAFILWGIVQLMPASDLSVELGNVVIALYVVDLALIVRDELRAAHVSAGDHPAIDRHGDASHI